MLMWEWMEFNGFWTSFGIIVVAVIVERSLRGPSIAQLQRVTFTLQYVWMSSLSDALCPLLHSAGS